ncbi:hypothetical protein [Bosea sp. BH3]|nr:hypothetical protein [Bosea sp. BH3]MCU4179114.1 hypothetical protein [Bosea sp. BH3]
MAIFLMRRLLGAIDVAVANALLALTGTAAWIAAFGWTGWRLLQLL